jgi:hypothetical protein
MLDSFYKTMQRTIPGDGYFPVMWKFFLSFVEPYNFSNQLHVQATVVNSE